MPTPDAYIKYGSKGGGMSLDGEEEDLAYRTSFLSGDDVEFFTPAGDSITIRYGGKATLKYFVDEKTLGEYDITLDDYDRFVEYLRTLGNVTIIQVIERLAPKI